MSSASAEARAQCAARFRIYITLAVRQEGKGEAPWQTLRLLGGDSETNRTRAIFPFAFRKSTAATKF